MSKTLEQHDMALRALKLTEVLPKLHPSGILELRLNTPKNLNAFSGVKYLVSPAEPTMLERADNKELIKGFDYARDTPDIKAVMVSSTGRFFSAGAALQPGGMASEGRSAGPTPAQLYVDMLIDFPKLAICALQGPAYGITVTTLPLFDLVYASPDASITTPFSRLGISLEGCSSVLFPPLFGTSLTTRLLYMAETIPLKDYLSSGLIAEVMDKEGLAEKVEAKVAAQLDELAIGSIIASKGQVRSEKYKAELHEINEREMAVVAERMQSQEHKDTITKFQARRAAEKAKKDATARL